MKAISKGMVESLHRQDETRKIVLGQTYIAALSDLFLCAGSMVSNTLAKKILVLIISQ